MISSIYLLWKWFSSHWIRGKYKFNRLILLMTTGTYSWSPSRSKVNSIPEWGKERGQKTNSTLLTIFMHSKMCILIDLQFSRKQLKEEENWYILWGSNANWNLNRSQIYQRWNEIWCMKCCIRITKVSFKQNKKRKKVKKFVCKQGKKNIVSILFSQMNVNINMRAMKYYILVHIPCT